MSHRQAVLLMLATTLMWSIAGVVSRHFDSASGFELTFWRSAFNALALIVMLSLLRGPPALWQSLRRGGKALWLSGLCWCVMFTAFMIALTLTDVANVLVTMALAPLFTALASRWVLGHRLLPRTWAAIVVAGLGIAWMYGQQVASGGTRHVLGTAVALCVPVAAATNWTLLQFIKNRRQTAPVSGDDNNMLTAVLLGALMSAAITLPLAMPFSATAHDIGLLALLGTVQLAIPCLLAVAAARVLPAPEISLLALLEVVFGVAWAWLGTGEKPTTAVLGGGLLVLGALAANEWVSLRQASRALA